VTNPQQPEVPRPGADPRLARAAEVIRLEARTIANLEPLLDARFLDAVDRVVRCPGMLVVTGMGKAGLVGAKISATFASTGTPSLALHPAEAMHGDLGRIRPQDLVLALSNSGETAEISALIPRTRAIGAGVIAMTGVPESTLGRLADCVLDIGRVDEACPLGLAPTASTSAMLALGDALAMVVLAERGFSKEDYARFHPLGTLGRRLMKVREVMRRGEELPLVKSGTRITDVLLAMSRTKGRPGAAIVVAPDGRLAGLFTDGDLRRLLETGGAERLSDPVDEVMTRTPKVADPEQLLEEAERLLREHKLDQVPVVDAAGRPVGLLDVQDILTARV
jgi:arabinose-5-phosphate isomerase